MAREGWYTDPFGRHEARWFSDGRPTGLVRDGGSTAMEPHPDGPHAFDPRRTGPSAPVAGDAPEGADVRPDDPDAVVDPVRADVTRHRGGA